MNGTHHTQCRIEHGDMHDGWMPEETVSRSLV
jgi:hypothetical protein